MRKELLAYFRHVELYDLDISYHKGTPTIVMGLTEPMSATKEILK